jgi:hypothetical protein
MVFRSSVVLLAFTRAPGLELCDGRRGFLLGLAETFANDDSLDGLPHLMADPLLGDAMTARHDEMERKGLIW